MRFCMFFIFAITFEPNQIQTRLAPQIQNDRLNLSFMKEIDVVDKKKGPEVVLKRPFSIRKFWESPSSLIYFNTV